MAMQKAMSQSPQRKLLRKKLQRRKLLRKKSMKQHLSLKLLHLSLKHLHQLLKSLLPLQSLKRLRLLLHLWLLRHQLLKLLHLLLLLWKHHRLRLRQLLKHQAIPHHAVSFRVLAPRRPLQRDPFLPTVHLSWHVRQVHCHQACRQVCHRV
jgi:hypothetical protein